MELRERERNGNEKLNQTVADEYLHATKFLSDVIG